MAPAVEALVVGLRREHPFWGRHGSSGRWHEPGRLSVYRVLLRRGLVDGKKRKRRREDCRRWERGRPARPLLRRSRSGRAGLS